MPKYEHDGDSCVLGKIDVPDLSNADLKSFTNQLTGDLVQRQFVFQVQPLT